MTKTASLSHNIYHGRIAVLATMHGKERVIAPILEKQLGLKIIVPKNFNTDKFGTFTTEIKRKGSQLQAAQAKAEAAMKLSGIDLAIASEGTFGPHPKIPFIPYNTELMLFIDSQKNMQICGHYRTTETNYNNAIIYKPQEIKQYANDWQAGEKEIILSLSSRSKRLIYKDLPISSLQDKAKKLLKIPFINSLHLQTDMRAFNNPLRQKSIAKATEDLAKNILSLCPQCGSPGFVQSKVIKGLPCVQCHSKTDLPLAFLYSCHNCQHSEQRPTPKTTSEPQDCFHCNP